MIKGKGQRLIPEELLKYLEAYKENHPDPAGGGGATLEDIVDSEGNKRFIEGDGVSDTDYTEAYYCKWSLSGTHLMCVCAGKFTGTLPSNTVIASFEFPDYVSDKIVPIASDVLDIRNFNVYSEYGTLQTTDQIWVKLTDKKIQFVQSGTLSGADKYFRIQFDLLIDADYS